MTFIIADIGSNCNTIQEAYISIEKAKESGADMAKFQLFSEHDLYGDGSTERKIQPWLPHLKDCCVANDIEFGCTAFSVEGLELVDPYVKWHKVASSCVTHKPLIEAIAKKGKHVLVSVGACSDEEIITCLEPLTGMLVTLLYCQASYPSRCCDLTEIIRLRAKFGVPVGYSDHTTNILGSPFDAVRYYAPTILEKHFTAFPLLESPDRPHSLTPAEFKMMVDACRTGDTSAARKEEERLFAQYCKVRQTDKGYYRVRK